MQLKQYYLGCLSHASYLIADDRTGVAAVVDPQRDVDQYVEDAEANGWKIRHVFLTHFHADFLAGHVELQKRTGATIYLGSKAEAEYAHQAVREGDVIELGDVQLRILETPGHTPEGISILVFDQAQNGEKPYAVLTGDTLFIGDVGRPDLMASVGVSATELAEMLYDSITHKLMQLPDDTLIYPAHGAGSLCGKQLSNEKVSTIGEQKQFNYALQPMSREAFIELVGADQPEAPAYFSYDAMRNRQARPGLEEAMEKSVKGLSLEEILRLQEEGCQIVDVREGIDFEGAHLRGALNVGLQGKYASWAGAMLSHKKPIVVIAESGNEEEAIMRLGRIGFDHVEGYLENGMAALEHRPDLIQTIPRMTAPALQQSLSGGEPPLVVDVRSEKEWEQSHIEGSRNMPLPRLREHVRELPRDRTVVVHCQSGYRSAIAASVMAQEGMENLYDLVGGIQAWQSSQLPVTATASVE